MALQRAAAISASLCLHGALLAFALRHPGPGMAGPDAGGQADDAFFVAAAPEPPAPPEPPNPPAPAIAEITPPPMQPLTDVDMILPLESIASEPVVGPAPKPAGTTHVRHRNARQQGARRGPGPGGGGGGGDYLAPAYFRNPAPAYPLEARLAGREGVVILEATVTEQGRPTDITVLQSCGDPVMDQTAATAVAHWIFHPATADGRPVSARVEVPVRFRLK